MTQATPLLAGILLALMIAAPIGPTAILLVQRTLSHGVQIGIASGAGVATAHALYALLGGFGLGLCTAQGEPCLDGMRLVAAIALAWFAWSMFTRAPRADDEHDPENGLRAIPAALGAIGFVLLNPMTALLYVAASVSQPWMVTTRGDSVAFVCGVFVGSLAWWSLLALAVGRFRAQLAPQLRQRLNRACAAMIGGFAAWSLVDALR